MDTTWTAQQPEKFLDLSKAQVKRLMGALPVDESNRQPDISNFHDMSTITAPESFDSRA